jgi:nitrogen fixation protein FixH
MSRIRLLRSIAFTSFSFCLVAGGVVTAQTSAAPKSEKKSEAAISFTTRPTPAVAGETTFTVTAKDASGKPITGGDVLVEFVMPPMGAMGEMKNKVTLKPATDPKLAAQGTYIGTGQIMMPGKWNVTVDVRLAGKTVAEKKLTVMAK